VTEHALFAVAPYVAAAAFVAFALYRLAALLRPGAKDGERGPLSPLQRGNRLWRAGLSGIVAVHASILFLPELLLRWTASLARLIAFEIAAVLFGLAAAAGLLAILAAHLRQRVLRSPRVVADAVVLGLVATTVGSGLGIAIAHRWALSWSLVTIAPYFRSLLALSPEVGLVDALPYLVRLHVLSALATLALLPLGHGLDPLLKPLSRLLAPALGAAGAAAQWSRARVEEAGRRAAHTLWWQEEEEE
jgi:nitrate reductase gamma subunit